MGSNPVKQCDFLGGSSSWLQLFDHHYYCWTLAQGEGLVTWISGKPTQQHLTKVWQHVWLGTFFLLHQYSFIDDKNQSHLWELLEESLAVMHLIYIINWLKIHFLFTFFLATHFTTKMRDRPAVTRLLRRDLIFKMCGELERWWKILNWISYFSRTTKNKKKNVSHKHISKSKQT